MSSPIVVATSLSAGHTISKTPQPAIDLEAGYGVRGDIHAGRTTQHLYLLRKDPTRRNLTEVHLLHAELLDSLGLTPGELGENLTTRHLDLHALPTGALLRAGKAVIQITGYRVPCYKIYKHGPGLLKQAFFSLKRPNAGIMGIVHTSGTVCAGDSIQITLPVGPHRPLGPV